MKGSSDEIDELRSSLAELNDHLDDVGIAIEELSQEMINLTEGVDELNDVVEQYDEQIESLQVNMTEANNQINQVDQAHRQLRNDFEYLKYDFRSFTNEISKWQIDVDERLSVTENQLQGYFWSFSLTNVV